MCSSVCLSVRPSAWNNSGPRGRILMLEYLSRICRETNSSLKYDKNTWKPIYCNLLSIVTQFFLKWQVYQAEAVEKIKTHKNLFGKSCYFLDDVANCGRDRQTTDKSIRRMRIAYWVTKAIDTHSEYVSVSTATTITRTRLRVTLYIHFLSCRKELYQDLNFNTLDRCGNTAIVCMFQKLAVQKIKLTEPYMWCTYVFYMHEFIRNISPKHWNYTFHISSSYFLIRLYSQRLRTYGLPALPIIGSEMGVTF
jgi:hypothetical protein